MKKRFVRNYTSYLSAARSHRCHKRPRLPRALFACRVRSVFSPRDGRRLEPARASPANPRRFLLGFGGKKELESATGSSTGRTSTSSTQRGRRVRRALPRTKPLGMGAIRTASTQRAGSPSSKSPRSPRTARLPEPASTDGGFLRGHRRRRAAQIRVPLLRRLGLRRSTSTRGAAPPRCVDGGSGRATRRGRCRATVSCRDAHAVDSRFSTRRSARRRRRFR